MGVEIYNYQKEKNILSRKLKHKFMASLNFILFVKWTFWLGM